MPLQGFQVGDWVVYLKSKRSVHPGPRARDVQPSEKGDGYSYVVEKLWVVVEVCQDGTLVLKTRRGKQHRLPATDPLLHKASLFQRLRYRTRFQEIEKAPLQEMGEQQAKDRKADDSES